MKNATDLKFGTHTPIDLSKEWLFIFSKKNDPEGRYPRKTAVSRGLSAYLLDCYVKFCNGSAAFEISLLPF